MDYYQILGVSKQATKDEIKKAFRTLAHKYHPDKKGGDEKKFKEIGEAYAVLSDDKKRAEYDAYGKAGGGASAGQGGGFGGFDFSGFQQGQGGFEFDMGDVFGDIFGGGRRERTPRGRDISVDIELSFKESIFGVKRTLSLHKVGTCSMCNGTGAEKGSELSTCTACGGLGRVQERKQTILGTFASTHRCGTCQGVGKVPKVKCGSCGGAGVRKTQEEFTLSVPAGIEHGEMLRVSGGGEAVAHGMPGDLYVKVHVTQDPRYKKEGVHIVMPLTVKLSDALLGATYTVETLDGPLSVKIPAGIAFGERLRVKGKGVPTQGGSRGDLYFMIHIPIPTKLSKNAKKAIELLQGEGL